jgi:hypothetical protein
MSDIWESYAKTVFLHEGEEDETEQNTVDSGKKFSFNLLDNTHSGAKPAFVFQKKTLSSLSNLLKDVYDFCEKYLFNGKILDEPIQQTIQTSLQTVSGKAGFAREANHTTPHTNVHMNVNKSALIKTYVVGHESLLSTAEMRNPKRKGSLLIKMKDFGLSKLDLVSSSFSDNINIPFVRSKEKNVTVSDPYTKTLHFHEDGTLLFDTKLPIKDFSQAGRESFLLFYMNQRDEHSSGMYKRAKGERVHVRENKFEDTNGNGQINLDDVDGYYVLVFGEQRLLYILKCNLSPISNQRPEEPMEHILLNPPPRPAQPQPSPPPPPSDIPPPPPKVVNIPSSGKGKRSKNQHLSNHDNSDTIWNLSDKLVQPLNGSPSNLRDVVMAHHEEYYWMTHSLFNGLAQILQQKIEPDFMTSDLLLFNNLDEAIQLGSNPEQLFQNFFVPDTLSLEEEEKGGKDLTLSAILELLKVGRLDHESNQMNKVEYNRLRLENDLMTTIFDYVAFNNPELQSFTTLQTESHLFTTTLLIEDNTPEKLTDFKVKNQTYVSQLLKRIIQSHEKSKMSVVQEEVDNLLSQQDGKKSSLTLYVLLLTLSEICIQLSTKLFSLKASLLESLSDSLDEMTLLKELVFPSLDFINEASLQQHATYEPSLYSSTLLLNRNQENNSKQTLAIENAYNVSETFGKKTMEDKRHVTSHVALEMIAGLSFVSKKFTHDLYNKKTLTTRGEDVESFTSFRDFFLFLKEIRDGGDNSKATEMNKKNENTVSQNLFTIHAQTVASDFLNALYDSVNKPSFTNQEQLRTMKQDLLFKRNVFSYNEERVQTKDIYEESVDISKHVEHQVSDKGESKVQLLLSGIQTIKALCNMKNLFIILLRVLLVSGKMVGNQNNLKENVPETAMSILVSLINMDHMNNTLLQSIKSTQEMDKTYISSQINNIQQKTREEINKNVLMYLF